MKKKIVCNVGFSAKFLYIEGKAIKDKTKANPKLSRSIIFSATLKTMFLKLWFWKTLIEVFNKSKSVLAWTLFFSLCFTL